jgi:hypothetical protein
MSDNSTQESVGEKCAAPNASKERQWQDDAEYSSIDGLMLA